MCRVSYPVVKQCSRSVSSIGVQSDVGCACLQLVSRSQTLTVRVWLRETSLQQGLLPLSPALWQLVWYLTWAVFGSTKIGIAAVNRNLEQDCSSHQFHLCPPNTWPQLMFKVQVVMLCYHWGWTGFQKGLSSGSQTSQVECECHHAFLHHLECALQKKIGCCNHWVVTLVAGDMQWLREGIRG